MIDFRYHIVSIVAVFLALAVGLVLGATALNGPLVVDLKGRNGGLIQDKRVLEKQVRDLQDEVGNERKFEGTVAPALVADRLAEQSVVLISAPGASQALADALVASVRQAGAAVTARVRLRDDYVAPEKAAAVDELVSRLALTAIPASSGTPAQRAAAALADVLVRPPGGRGRPPGAVTAVLTGFRDAGLLSLDGPEATPGTLAVLIVPAVPRQPASPDPAGAAATASLLALVRALDVGGAGTVVVGPSAVADAAGVVPAVRGDNGTRQIVSSVDSADTPAGRVATVFALAEQLHGGAGHYGVAAGATAPLPLPSPSPSPTP